MPGSGLVTSVVYAWYDPEWLTARFPTVVGAPNRLLAALELGIAGLMSMLGLYLIVDALIKMFKSVRRS